MTKHRPGFSSAGFHTVVLAVSCAASAFLMSLLGSQPASASVEVVSFGDRGHVVGDDSDNRIGMKWSPLSGRAALSVDDGAIVASVPCRAARLPGSWRTLRSSVTCPWPKKLAVASGNGRDTIRFSPNFPTTTDPVRDPGPPEAPGLLLTVDGQDGPDQINAPDGSLVLGGRGADSLVVDRIMLPPGVQDPLPEVEVEPGGMGFSSRCHQTWVFGGGGDDQITGSDCSETISGGNGRDWVYSAGTRTVAGVPLGSGDRVFVDEARALGGTYNTSSGLFDPEPLIGLVRERDEVKCSSDADRRLPGSIQADALDEIDPAGGLESCKGATGEQGFEPIAFNRWPTQWPHLFEHLYPDLNRP